MHDTLADDLQPVVVRWTMGGQAAPLAPGPIADRLGDDPDEAELRLLVLAGQALGMMVVPEPAGGLQGVPDLPALALPTMPAALRPIAAPILSGRDEWLRDGLLRLLEARGYVVHPADWMPGANADVPDVYAPWQDWMKGIEAAKGPGSPGWDDLGPAARLAMLGGLRRSDPQAALDLVARRISGETPERRLAMVRILAVRLAESDRPFLEGLSGDRAPTVRAEASRLLSRIGGAVRGGLSDDISDLVQVSSKLLTGRRSITLKARMNHAQQARLEKVIAATDATTFAAALGVADADLPSLWPWGQDIVVDQRFADLLTGTGSEDVVRAIETRLGDGTGIGVHTLREGARRLSPASQADLVRASFRQETPLSSIVSSAPVLGVVEDLGKNAEWRSVQLQLLRDADPDASVGLTTLQALGLLATRDAARTVLDSLARTSLRAGDARLDTLRINAAL
jgi:hypothetical protein